MNTTNHATVEAALQRLQNWSVGPRALPLTTADRQHLRQATERAAGQLLGETEQVLTIALAGCSGAGKSTLINALAGSAVARVAEERPCTSQIQVYHHEAIGRGGLPKALTNQAGFVLHNRPELRDKIIVDTPDLDTFAAQHRLAAQALLKSAGLVIYVFSPEKYWEERVWSVIREEQRFSSAIAVLNKANTVAPETAERIVEEIRQRFAEIGSPAIRVLRICATCHAPDHRGQHHSLPEGVLDEFSLLRAIIEQELQTGDIAQMRQAQRIRVVDHLEGVIDQIAPADLAVRLDALQCYAEERAQVAGEAFTQVLAPRLQAVEQELAPLVALHRQHLFWGPLRLWFAVFTFLSYGLPQAIRRLRFFRWGEEKQTDLQRLLVTGMSDKAATQVRTESRILQDHCFTTALPVGHWQQTTAASDGNHLLQQIADAIQDHFIAATSSPTAPRRFVWFLSLLGVLLPGLLLGFALLQIVHSLATLDAALGYQMVGLALIGVIISQLLLVGVASLALPVRRTIHGQRGLAAQCVQAVVREMMVDWVKSYRTELEANLTELRQPLRVLRETVSAVDQVEDQATILVAAEQHIQHHRQETTEQGEAPTSPPVAQELNPFLRSFRMAYRTEAGDAA